MNNPTPCTGTNCATQGGTPGSDKLTVYNDRYRMVAALYSDSNAHLVKYTQNGNTFLLNNPVCDFTGAGQDNCGTTLGTAAVKIPLSVPKGIQVVAFGRILGGTSSQILVTSPTNTNPPAPTTFLTGPPGYTTNSSSGSTTFPFNVPTDTSGDIQVQASSNGANSTTVNEATDGWIWNRGQ